MVNRYATLLSLTLTTSFALAAPLSRDLLERDLVDEEFSGREYLSNAYDDLSAREPNFFSGIGNAFKNVEREAAKVGKAAVKGVEVAGKIANNPIVQTASSFLPGGGEIVAAERIVGKIGDKVQQMDNAAQKAGRTIRKVEGAVKKGIKAERAVVRKVKAVAHNLKRPGAPGKVKAVKHAVAAARRTAVRHHKRDLEEADEEFSRRDLDAEELFEREYDDILAERDFFDDLD